MHQEEQDRAEIAKIDGTGLSIESAESVEVFNLLSSWELSFDAIKTVIDCRINTISRLKMLNMDDINELFNSRNLLGEKVCFRYHLQKWRLETNVSTLDYFDIILSIILLLNVKNDFYFSSANRCKVLEAFLVIQAASKITLTLLLYLTLNLILEKC